LWQIAIIRCLDFIVYFLLSLVFTNPNQYHLIVLVLYTSNLTSPCAFDTLFITKTYSCTCVHVRYQLSLLLEKGEGYNRLWQLETSVIWNYDSHWDESNGLMSKEGFYSMQEWFGLDPQHLDHAYWSFNPIWNNIFFLDFESNIIFFSMVKSIFISYLSCLNVYNDNLEIMIYK
jgi:hypothetical protein